MMTQLLPATVEELNLLQHTDSPSSLFKKLDNQGFEDIAVEKKFKREISLPNGLENWNISNFDSYLNFEDNAAGNNFDVIASPGDRLVPDDDQRGPSISSVSSFIDDKRPTFHNFGVKTFNTVCMDSGSTCISSDHTYISSNSVFHQGLDPEETYQNLDLFLQEVPDIAANNETISSSLSSMPSTSSNDTSFELKALRNYKSMCTNSQDSFTENKSVKRFLDSCSDDDVFVVKQTKHEFEETVVGGRYHEIRRKNNLASKNCRKTRKEKQKEMESKVSELEQEKEHLKVKVQVLEELIQAHKTCLLNAIVQKR